MDDPRLTDEVRTSLDRWRTEWGILAQGADAGIRHQNLDDLVWKVSRALTQAYPYLEGGLTGVEDAIEVCHMLYTVLCFDTAFAAHLEVFRSGRNHG